MIQKLRLRLSGVSFARSPAGPATNTAPTSTIRIMMKARITILVCLPRNLPMSSGRLSPLLRRDIIPDM